MEIPVKALAVDCRMRLASERVSPLMVRLYVGGLADSTTSAELAQRFGSFGNVSMCEVAPPKPDDTLRPPTCSCRGFGHLCLDPKDEASLRKCLQLYNGSRWRGKVLQVQVAKPHFIAKLGEEKALAAEEQAQQDRSLKRTEEVRLEKPITLVLANGQEHKVIPNKRKQSFPEHPGKTIGKLSWRDLPVTEATKRKVAFEEEMGAAWAAKTAEQAAKNASKRRQGSASESSEEPGRISFMDEGNRAAHLPANLDHFSDGEDQDLHEGKARRPVGEAEGTAFPGPAIDEEAAALWDQQGGWGAYLAALQAQADGGQQEEGLAAEWTLSEIKMEAMGHDEPGMHESSIDMTGESSPNSSHKASMSSEEQHCHLHGSDSAEEEDEVAGSESEQSELASSSESQPSVEVAEDSQPTAGQQESQKSRAGGADVQISLSDSPSGGESEPPESASAGSEELPLHDATMKALSTEMKAGAQFWAGGLGADQLEDQWRSGRDRLANDSKQARRDACRRVQSLRFPRHLQRLS